MNLLTIIIPTHNRTNYLWRCIKYLNDSNIEWPVAIVDSSDDKFFRKNEVNVKSLGSDKFKHLDCRGMTLHEKYEYALQLVKSRYLVLSGDDDFLVPQGIKECLRVLESNKNCSHAHGRVMVFWESLLPSNPIMRIREYPQSGNKNNLHKRLAGHLNEYRNNFYAVHRTEDFKKAFRLTVKVDVCTELLERILAFETIIAGEREMVDGVLIFRQKGITGVDELGNKTFPALNDVFDDGCAQYKDLHAYISYIASRLHELTELSPRQRSEILNYAIADYKKWIDSTLRRHAEIGLKKLYLFPYYKFKNFCQTKIAEKMIAVSDEEAYSRVSESIGIHLREKHGNAPP